MQESCSPKLRKRHGIVLAKETMRRIIVDVDFRVPREQRVELWAAGVSLPYTTYDRLSENPNRRVVEQWLWQRRCPARPF